MQSTNSAKAIERLADASELPAKDAPVEEASGQSPEALLALLLALDLLKRAVARPHWPQ